MEIKDRVVAVIDALELSQEKVAELAAAKGRNLTRNDVNKVCTGRNQATSERIRSGLSAGLGIARDDLNAYLEGEMTLVDVLRRRARVPSLRLVGEARGPKFGELPGWLEAEKEAREQGAMFGSEVELVDFYGARDWEVFGVPDEVTPRFVLTTAWLWRKTADTEKRQRAAELMRKEISQMR